MKSTAAIEKSIGHISAILKGILFTGISIQTVLGIVWMCCHFSHVPQFGESIFYLQVSQTLGCDEYTGILYPAFLRITGRNHVVIYGVQLAAAFAASWRFLRVFMARGKWKVLWGSLAFVTMPIAMQCHMAVLPCSFAASLLLTELSLLTEAVRKVENRTLKRLAEIALCWLALAQLLPEYRYLGAVPVVLFGLCCGFRWRENRRMLLYGILLAAAFAGMTVGISSLIRTPGLYGRLQKTPLMSLTQRVVWTSIPVDYGDWPWEMVYPVDEVRAYESAEYADGMDRVFFPAMEQAIEAQEITPGQAGDFYLEMMRMTWMWHGPEILKEILWDVLGYGASPVCLQLFLMGRGYDTYSRNYEFFLEKTPGLSRLYMDYGSWWFAVSAVLAVLLQILCGKEERKTAEGAVWCCLITAGSLIFWYTMQGAGMQDYKNTVLIPQLWMAWPVLLWGRERVGSLSLKGNGGKEAAK